MIPVAEALAGKRVLVGVSGGIAAYKAPDLVRRLRERGAEVRVVMTRAAGAFVTPLSLQAVAGHPVRTELLDPAAEAGMDHIELARWADAVLVAPATADVLARLAHGLADDLLTTLCLACAAPLVVAPAMNRQMWEAPATRANCALLAARGVTFLGPALGEQACGEVGAGRMVEPLALAEDLAALLGAGPATGVLAGLAVVITAGPTREPIDPVRYISNRSSGRMGYAVARAALRAGARVTLVSGPVAIAPPAGARVVNVTTAEEMAQAVRAALPGADLFIGAAAVADYRPARAAGSKIKKTAARLDLALERTTDILAEAARREPPLFAVGFAAETDDVERNARAKLEGKGLALVAANRVGATGPGFDTEDNELHVYWQGGDRHLPRAPKERLAEVLVDLIAERYRATEPAAGAGRTAGAGADA